MTNYMLNGKAAIVLLTVGLIKKTQYERVNIFLNRELWRGGRRGRGGDVKVELDLSNYPTKINLRNVSGVHTSKFVKKIDLDSLKSEIN